MQNHPTWGRLYSASDIVAFLGCRHRSTLDLRRLEGWDVQPVAADAAMQLVQDHGNRHELAHLAALRADGRRVVEIGKDLSLDDKLAATRQAMAEGADVIFQATLLKPPFVGHADFLLRVEGPSRLGAHHYEVADTKLAKSNRAKFLVQLCLYGDLLEQEQGRLPQTLQVVLGRLTDAERQARGLSPGADHVARLRTEDYIHYFRALRAAFLDFVGRPPATTAAPVPACAQCGWRSHCGDEWERVDHLSRVANIRRDQVDKLEAAGIRTLAQLARMEGTAKGIGAEVLDRLKRQAALQHQPLDAEGRLRIERLPLRDDKPRGFQLLPEPDAGDLYFDMEGFPHEPGGLEYLFGVGYLEGGDARRFRFKAFWAHDREQEKQAFEAFMDFVAQWLALHPRAHIYHYAAYEQTAIKRLSSVHDTRTELRDRLLREGRLVDLYRVVTSGLLLALPGYSIKRVEAYYRGRRQGEVSNAGDSIVQYEAYRVATDPDARKKLLASIEAYNHDDVESTWLLHRWLQALRPPQLPAFEPPPSDAADDAERNAKRAAHEQREAAARHALQAWAAQQAPSEQAEAQRLAELLGQLLGFYWRCKLPGRWRSYERSQQEEVELLDDLECLALLRFTGHISEEARSLRYHFEVPDQETKLHNGASVRCLTDGGPASNFEFDAEAGTASFTRGVRQPAPPALLTLCAADGIRTDQKLDALYRCVDRLVTDGEDQDAVLGLLRRGPPRLQGRATGAPVAASADVDAVLAAVGALDGSHLVIQGPPGTGKTTTASQVIAALLARGCNVAVTSNSHAALNHLLLAAHRRNLEGSSPVAAAVVAGDTAADLPDTVLRLQRDDIDPRRHRLVGATPFVLCRPEHHRQWDYLFVDEASQVSLADVVAAGACARNIVLLGDQMQLPQPVQGIHPGDSGLSVLDYLMVGHATVPAELGIFLGTSHRMHPDVCRPISQGVYEGRLQAASACARQRLVLGAGADPALRASGVVHVPVRHRQRSQRSPEEAQRIAELWHSLQQQHWCNRDGQCAPIGPADILVVAPYRAQVRELQQALGPQARVGTVDKFQGQEAAVSILSMTTSDGDDVPRGLEFLFSKNRLNVAVSRAKCLALVVGSPALSTIETDRVEDMQRLSFYSRLVGG